MTARHPGTVGQCRLACASGLATLLAFGMFGTARAQGVITSTRDSSGVRITSSDVSGAPTWILSPEPALQVGVIDGDHPYRFDRIEAAFRLGDGRLVVADRGSNELRFFSSSGKHVRTVGRRGAGPGEFEFLPAVVKLPGDSLLVHDIRNRRLTLISPEGTISHEAVNAEVPFLRAGSLLGTVSDGRLLFRLTPPLVVGHNQGFRRDTVLVATARRGDSALDTLIRLPSAERFRRGAVTHVHPFGHNAVAAAWNGEIVVGTGETHELRILDSVGHLSAIMRRSDVPRLPLSRAVVAVYLE